MPVIGHGVEICTYTTRPSNPTLGTIIYQTDTDEYLKWVNYGGANRWMQADLKPGRRLNINGNLVAWQRGAGPVTTDGAYLADRYQTYNTTSQSRSTDVPSGMGFPYSLSFGNPSTSYALMQHKLEAIDSLKLVGKWLTISFWAKNVSGTVGVYADFLHANSADNWGTLTNWSSSISQAIVPTSTWTYYSFTSGVVTPANGANGVGFYIPRNNGASTTLVTGIQLEVGTAPSEFEFESLETTLKKCQRYFCAENVYATSGFDSGYSINTATAYFPVQMRIVPNVPAMTVTAVGHASGTANAVNVTRASVQPQLSSGNAAYRTYSTRWEFTYAANAEL